LELGTLTFGFPIGIVFAINGREKVKRLWKTGVENVLGKHGIEPWDREVEPVFKNVLGIVRPVLANDGNLGVVEQARKKSNDFSFLVAGPTGGVAYCEWDTHGFGCRRGKANAGNVTGSGFDIAGQRNGV